MTNREPNRLDRIEAILEEIASKEAEFNNRIDSNARTIQAMLEQQATDRLRHEERMSRLEEKSIELQDVIIQMTRVENGLARILGSLDEDRPIILRRLMSIENKLDRLLEENN